MAAQVVVGGLVFGASISGPCKDGPAMHRNLRIDHVLRRPARGQGLPRQDAQFRFGPVEPAAVPGRKHQLYALG